MAFELFEGSEEDVPLVAEIFVAAMSKDLQWQSLMRDVKFEDWLAWQVEYFKLRWKLPDKRLFFARETATGKVVGYTILGLPGNFSKEQIDASSGVPPMPEGVNQVILKAMVALIGISKEHGYDSTKHYHRKGIAVLPEYQRRGIARMLSERLNEIVDEEGGATYVVTMPVSSQLFATQEFEIVGIRSMDMTEFGGAPSDGNNYVMLRKPHGNTNASLES
ncbi:hypothetical protein BKA65DRAFT_478333 [Rhexocercosporidium sp. MPI-PUGE-AT-0058]|nr:hypothetical protein BKA65DRAFT_478333 [Rhexocercosporidium sp. MPI-PUGE-AT-0058]